MDDGVCMLVVFCVVSGAPVHASLSLAGNDGRVRRLASIPYLMAGLRILVLAGRLPSASCALFPESDGAHGPCSGLGIRPRWFRAAATGRRDTQ